MFLKRVYKEWKVLFVAIILFISAQVFFTYKGIENIPFFLYHMFAFAHESKDSMTVILMKTTGGYIDPFQLSERESEILLNNISYYIKLKENNYKDYINQSIERRFKSNFSPRFYKYALQGLSNDSSSVNHYPNWWGQYFKTLYKQKYDSIQVVSGKVSYNPTFNKSAVDSVIFTIHFK